MKKVLVDGHSGTVSLNLKSLVCQRNDLEVICLEDKSRFTEQQRLSLLNTADIVILCQSSKTAVETLPLIENPSTKVIDTSNAFRFAPGWAYGLPELAPDQRSKIASSRLVSMPAAMVTGAALLVAPLTKYKIMPPYHPLYVNATLGYSSGGSNMISLYEDPHRPEAFGTLRQYALDQQILQQKELMHACNLSYRPCISPVIMDYPNGAYVTVPLHLRTLSKRLHSEQIWETMRRFYEKEKLVRVVEFAGASESVGGFLDPYPTVGTPFADIFVFGDNDICLLAVRYDNLGKGGASACVQCMNLMLGLNETEGLI